MSVELITLRTFSKKLYVLKCSTECRLYNSPSFCCILFKHCVKLVIGHAYKYYKYLGTDYNNFYLLHINLQLELTFYIDMSVNVSKLVITVLYELLILVYILGGVVGGFFFQFYKKKLYTRVKS